jgi:murein L,D-transpeptidase YafK
MGISELNHDLMTRHFILVIWLCLLSPAATAASLAEAPGTAGSGHRGGEAGGLVSGSAEEALLLRGIEALAQNRIEDALDLLEALVARRPDFRLAQLVYADLLSARIRPLGGFGNFEQAAADGLEALRDEARRRLAHHRGAPAGNRIPENLVMPARDQKHVIVVDVPASRLYVFANDGGTLTRVTDQYVSSGKNGARKLREGDQRTPVGVYFLTGRISPAALPDFYGSGALPINYPNEWDMRLGRTGYGIWIHGVPTDTYSRAPQASDGCIAVANSDLESLFGMVPDGNAPVIISDGVRWVPPAVMRSRQEEIRAMLDDWRRDWESLSFERYSGHYSRSFVSDGMGRIAWLQKKRRINAAKSYIRVDFSNLSAFAYPGERDLLVVTFDQNYRSSNFNDKSKKRQYWRRESDGRWRIIFEEEARFLEVHFRGLPYSARAKLTRVQKSSGVE